MRVQDLGDDLDVVFGGWRGDCGGVGGAQGLGELADKGRGRESVLLI